MLLLWRKLGSKTILTLADGRTIEVVAIAAQGGKIKLGFAAPADVKIERPERMEKAT